MKSNFAFYIKKRRMHHNPEVCEGRGRRKALANKILLSESNNKVVPSA